jgi:radical SAM family uncharacterized protein
MTDSTLAQRISTELLPRVRHPAQYIGGEVNQLVRPADWDDAAVRVVVAFPDTYTLGTSHLGCQIIYWLCNHTPGVCAERTYCPWIDAEAVMRQRGIPLFTWDTRRPVRSADILAISLQYEMCFTNVVNLLDLAGIPVWSVDRDDSHPLVIAGGPQADNPEPMAPFIDLFVMGDGEHSMAAILDAYRQYKDAGVSRREMILLMARRFPWVYAPAYYEPAYHLDGTLAGLLPLAEGIPARIERCRTPDFETAPFPTRPIVPWVTVVHDRISIEIMRGCPQVCRFCHAGYTKRPLHLRSVERVLQIADEAYWATGHHELGLLSLSTADYPHLPELAARIHERFGDRLVNISLPSLRVDKMLAHIPWLSNNVRKGGLTIAVEAARDDMRQAIRKKVTDGRLLDGVRAAYQAGWNRVKLYFMAGFPAERTEDIRGIWELASAVSQERVAVAGRPAEVTASVGWLVPKPFTPLQWMAQPRVEYFREVRRMLRDLAHGALGYESSLRDAISTSQAESDAAPESSPAAAELPRSRPRGRKRSPVRIVTHDPERSILEAVFARGDRRLAPVIHEAWKRGARFDGWDETFRNEIWLDAYMATGIDPDWYAHRERRPDELLPWDHIGLHMRRGYLEESYQEMYETIGRARPEAGIARPLPILTPR